MSEYTSQSYDECTLYNASNIWIDLYNGPPSKGDQDILHILHLSLNIPHHTPENIFCRAFVTGNWNTLLFVPLLFVEMTLKGSKQGVIAMHWRRSFSAPYYWAISYCHLGLRTRSRFRTLILNNPKFDHCCISWSLPEVSFFFTNEVFWFSPAPSFADDPDKTKTTPKTLGGAKAD